MNKKCKYCSETDVSKLRVWRGNPCNVCVECYKQNMSKSVSKGQTKAWENKKDEILEKRKQTALNKWGTTHHMKNKTFKENFDMQVTEKFGVDNVWKSKEIIEKIKETKTKKYGVNNNLNSEEGIKQKKKTWMTNYGVDNPMKSQNIIDKSNNTKDKNGTMFNHCYIPLLEYKNTTLKYQGSYEKDFLDTFSEKIKIENGPTIKYTYKNKNSRYYSDFFIPSYNLIIEIKSTYTFNNAKKINLAKQKACLEQGYNFIFIVDKDYEPLKDFNLFISDGRI